MTAKNTDLVEFVAKETGFYDGHRIRPNGTFHAPADFKANWALTKEQLAEQGNSVHENPIRALLDGEPKEVVARIGTSGLSTPEEFKRAIDAEASGAKRKLVLSKLGDAMENAKTEKLNAAAEGKLPRTHGKVELPADAKAAEKADKDDDLLS